MAEFYYRHPFRAVLEDAGSVEATRARLDSLARLLDSAFRIPGTEVRVGADALLNLIPGIGTLAAQGISGYIIWEAHRLGVPTTTLVHMAANVGFDFVIGSIPVVGWVGDVFFRANNNNIALLRAHLDRHHPRPAPRPGVSDGG